MERTSKASIASESMRERGEQHGRDAFRAFVFRTRGLYLALSVLVILLLKHAAGSRVSLPVYLACLTLGVLVLGFRMWAAGFVGRTARSGQTHADALLTAGPYAYVRNPMYLSALVLGSLFGVMSGLWYTPLIWLGAYAFVYSQVIPHEERFLREKFGAAYEEYCRNVPRLVPSAKGYRDRVFSLRESLRNEVAPLVFLPVFWVLYWRF